MLNFLLWLPLAFGLIAAASITTPSAAVQAVDSWST